MSQAGYTPIQLYYSTTAAAAPSAGNLANGELAVNITDGKLFYKDNGGVVRVLATAAGSAGDVVGPGSSTDNALVRFDGTTGKLVQNSAGVLDDSGNLTGLASLTATTITGALTGTVGATTPNTGAFTTLSASGAVTFSGGTANGVAYLNGSKVLTTGSALTFDGTNLGVGALNTNALLTLNGDKTALRVERGSAVGFAYNTGTAATDSFRIQSNAGPVDIYTASGQPITFSAGAAEQMRLTSTGLGIGTSSPGVKLDTVGVMRGTFNSTSNGGETSHGLTLRQSTTSTKALIAGYSTSGNQTGAYIQAVNFGTAYEDLVIQPQGGNLGLGVTPSAWGSPFVAMQIGTGGASLSGRTDGQQVNLATNWRFGSGTNSYIANGFASRYAQESGVHVWYTAPSGTAGNAISFTQAMTLDASGNWFLGGTSTPFASSGRTVATINGSSQALLGLTVGGTDKAYLYTDGTNTTLSNSPAGALIFATNAGTERARIDSSGNLLVGTTSQISADKVGIKFTGAVNNGLSLADTQASGDAVRFFANTSTQVGSITHTATTTAYNTSSDYRLKNITGPITTSGAYIDSLNPVEGTWKADGSTFVGLIAHEVQEASRTQVATGVKDGEQMQGMDYSSAEIIANLIAELQSVRKRLAALEAA